MIETFPIEKPEQLSILSAKLLIIDVNQNCLLIRRSKNSRHGAGLYELPGGKIDGLENISYGLSREIFEATNLLLNLEYVSFNEILQYSIVDQSHYHGYCFQQKAGLINYPFDLNHSRIQLSPEHDDWKIIPSSGLLNSDLPLTEPTINILERLLDTRLSR